MPTTLPFNVSNVESIIVDVAFLVAAVLLANLLHKIIAALLTRFFGKSNHAFIKTILQLCGPPARWLAVITAVWVTLGLCVLSPDADEYIRHILGMAFIFIFAWLVIALIHLGREWILRRYEITQADNLNARRVHTQIKLIERIVIALIVIITIGCILMTFDKVRQLGVSLLASAGIAGVILGLAAQKILGTFLAGIQIAITEPIRIDDVVIVEGEWGQIEEITLTYIVVRIWDLRRLIVPSSYFLEKPFQNWTRVSADLLGTVFIYADPSVVVNPIRAELQRLLVESPLWDKKAWCLQVTDATERTVQLRALMSADNASALFDLRCLVREQLLQFISAHQPTAFPRFRVDDISPPNRSMSSVQVADAGTGIPPQRP